MTYHPVDVHIGKAIKLRRTRLGISQTMLGWAMDKLSFQQVQKYECGKNRVSASMLYLAAKKLGCHPGEFYDGFLGIDIYDPEKPSQIGKASQALMDFPAIEKLSLLTPTQRRAISAILDEMVKTNSGTAVDKS